MVLDDMRDEIYRLKAEIKRLRDVLEEVGNILYVDADGIGDIVEAEIIIKEALKDGE